MNDSDRNNPKPLPDDFGMTIPNMRPPKQDQSSGANLPTTNLRNAPQPSSQNPYHVPPPAAAPPDNFGMTIPNMRPTNQQLPPMNQPPPSPQVNDFDSTAPNIRLPQQPPSEPDFGITLNNFQPKNSAEPDYGATMSYIPAPARQRETNREQVREDQPLILPQTQTKAAEPRKNAIPLWAWLLTGGFGLFLLLIVTAVAVYFLIPRSSGFTLVLKGAPSGSTVLVDGTLRGTTSGDGSINIPAVEAEKKRAIKVTREGFTDFNDTIIGENGETKELVVQMKKTETITAPTPQKNDCADDPRVCTGEKLALDALDKLVPPFTVDQWVTAMNLQIINFDSNSADVPFARKTVLEKGAAKFKLLTGNPGVEIGGHTDNVGNDGSNQKLSESRAQAVRFILVNNGVNPKAFAPRGYGSKKPKVANVTEEGKFQNRRIEYTVTTR